MNIVITYIRTIAGYACIAFVGIICIIPCFIIALLPEKYRYTNRVFFLLAHVFYKTALFALFVPKKIVGQNNIPTMPVIFVANHQSSVDIPVMGALCNGYPHAWIVLEYYTNTPVLGFFIRRMFISVDQRSPGKAARSLIRAIEALEVERRALIIFPEGGRFIDGKIHSFFKGFAVIARKTGYPVVPVYLANNGKIYPPTSLLCYYYPLEIIIGKSFIYGSEDTEQLFTKKVRQWFVEQSEKVTV